MLPVCACVCVRDHVCVSVGLGFFDVGFWCKSNCFCQRLFVGRQNVGRVRFCILEQAHRKHQKLERCPKSLALFTSRKHFSFIHTNFACLRRQFISSASLLCVYGSGSFVWDTVKERLRLAALPPFVDFFLLLRLHSWLLTEDRATMHIGQRCGLAIGLFIINIWINTAMRWKCDESCRHSNTFLAPQSLSIFPFRYLALQTCVRSICQWRAFADDSHPQTSLYHNSIETNGVYFFILKYETCNFVSDWGVGFQWKMESISRTVELTHTQITGNDVVLNGSKKCW